MTAKELVQNAHKCLNTMLYDAHIEESTLIDNFCFVMNTVDYNNVHEELGLEIECDKLFGYDLVHDGRCPKGHLYFMAKEKLYG